MYRYVIGECMIGDDVCVTEEDRANAFIRKFHGNVWVITDYFTPTSVDITPYTQMWIIRNQFTEVTREEAQQQVNAQFMDIIDPLTNLPTVPPALPI